MTWSFSTSGSGGGVARLVLARALVAPLSLGEVGANGLEGVVVLHERQRRVGCPIGFGAGAGAAHVIGVGEAEITVEAVACGQKLRLIADVPFADGDGGVAL